MTIRHLGDRALRIELGEGLDPDVSGLVHALLRSLDAMRLDGVRDLIPGLGTLTVVYDPLRATPADLEHSILQCRDEGPPAGSGGRTLEIPVVYGGAHGPDLEDVAALHGLAPDAVVALHARPEYRVYAIGFMPGFPYLGVLPDEIATPRLDTPRPLVPRGSVAIAGRQTGIYPSPSPGGWRILGWTPAVLFDAGRAPPSLLDAGDRVHFLPVTETEAVAWRPSSAWR